MLIALSGSMSTAEKHMVCGPTPNRGNSFDLRLAVLVGNSLQGSWLIHYDETAMDVAQTLATLFGYDEGFGYGGAEIFEPDSGLKMKTHARL